MSRRKTLSGYSVWQHVMLAVTTLLFGMAILSSARAAEFGKLTLLPGISSPVNLHNHVLSLEDRTNDLTLEDILQMPAENFVPSPGIPSFGYTGDTVWYRLALSVPEGLNEPLHLEIRPSYMNFIDVYLIKQGTSRHFWQSRMGDHIPASQRPIKGSEQVDRFPPLEAGDYVLVIRTKSNSTQFLMAKLWPTNQLVSSLTLRDSGLSIYFGVILMLGVVYIILGTLARDRAIAAYGSCVLSIGTLASSASGLALSILQPEWPYANDLIVGGSNAMAAAATIFLWFYILDLNRQNNVVARIIKIYCVLSIACALTATNNFYALYGTYIVPLHAVLLTTFCIVLAYRIIRAPTEWLLWLYFVVLALPTGAAVLLQLTHAGLIEATPLRLGLHQFTLLFHMCAMSVIMGFRLSRIEKERMDMVKIAAATTSLVGEQRKLISMLSHEFRTPLAVIQRSSEMLSLRLREARSDVTDRLQRIQDQARKLSRLVDIFLNKDGIDDGDFALARELVPVNRLLADFVSNTSRADAEITLECIGTEGLETYVDVTLVGLAITNLIETARRYAHGAPIHVAARPNSDWLVEIVIPYHGQDLNSDEIRRISDALFRREVEAASLQSALGLHISQRIVDAHGGSIKMRDKGTNGVELCLLLPCDEITGSFDN